MTADPSLGMSLTTDAMHHVAAFVDCNESVVILHLMLDHHVDAQAIASEPTTVMLHMHLHGQVFQMPDDEADTNTDTNGDGESDADAAG